MHQATPVQELLDRQAIRDCLIRYARGVDRVHPDGISGAYHLRSWDEHGAARPEHDPIKEGTWTESFW